jgi:hypothetical protein
MRSGQIGFVILVFAACACNRGSRANVEGIRAIDGAQRAAVLAAVDQLRNFLNAGACQAIYDRAADSLRRGESARDWLRDCGQLREKLGIWETFDPSHAETYGFGKRGEDAIVEGPALFSSSIGSIVVNWQRNGNSFLLVGLSLETKGDIITLPDRFLKNYWDPPMDRAKTL